MLEKVTFVCSECGQRQSIGNPKKVQFRTVNCCKCGHPETVYFDTDMTLIDKKRMAADTGFYLSHNGRKYELEEADNTIGRMSSAHEAEVELLIEDDRSVSRKHCKIRVVRLKRGDIKSIISDERTEQKIEQKPTLVNGVPLCKEDEIVLSDGDVIIMGRQTVLFCKKEKSL